MEERIINILLVEDDEVDIMNVQRAFRKNKITNPLYIAENGLEALAMLRSQNGKNQIVPPFRRLILLDLNMPKMNGLEFLHQLKSTPVVVLTTSAEDRDRLEAYNLNVAGYLLKPVTFANFDKIMTTLNNYWALSEMPS
jgi:CheY-like chemotaxis protein